MMECIIATVGKITNIQKQDIEKCIEKTKNRKMGDYSIILVKLNNFGWTNNSLLMEELGKTDIGIIEMKIEKNYLNIKIDKKEMNKKIVKDILEKRDKYGHKNEGEGKTIIVEYSSPNIAKPFHIGHLRSTILGNYIKKIHESQGYNVISINYLGDWGKQYGLLAIGYELFGEEEKLEKEPIKHLFEIYVKINKLAEEDEKIHEQAREYFQKMEQGDPLLLSLWQKFRNISLKEYERLYQRLGVHFDIYSGESQTCSDLPSLYQQLQDKNLLNSNEGAQFVDLSFLNLGKALVTKSNGTTLYLTRDLVEAMKRYRTYNFHKMFYVVGHQQQLHFSQLFHILSLLDCSWSSSCSHISFGLVKGMSTRQGNVVFLEDILDTAKEQMLQVIHQHPEKLSPNTDPLQVAEQLALSSVIIQDFSSKRSNSYDFNWSRMTSFEGYTGPYLQYTHVRLFSILQKTQSTVPLDLSSDLSLLSESQAIDLLQSLGDFPSILSLSFSSLEPHILVSYLFNLSHLISSCLTSLRVLGCSSLPLAQSRLLLFYLSHIVLHNGMSLLGLTPLQSM